MRSSNRKRSATTVMIALAALFAASMAVSKPAQASAVEGHKPAAITPTAEAALQLAAISRSEARSARRFIRSSMRTDCRQNNTGENRRACNREARNQMREYRNEARSVFQDCRSAGGSRADCRQARREYWLDRANGDTGTDTGTGGTGDAPRSDD